MDITVTIPDTIMPKLQKAFGRLVAQNPNNPAVQVLQDATIADLQQEIIGFLRSRTIEADVSSAAQAARQTASSVRWT